jgi:trimethyllysine dioxygenase
MSHGDLAYSTEGLPAHTDTTYFTDPAGLQIFHLLSHPPPGTGGTTLLVDAFYTAALLETLHPTLYDVLSRLRIPCHASGTPGTLMRPPLSQPVLQHDENGRLVQVRWNNEDRGVLGQGWQAEDVGAWYRAARIFEELSRAPDAEYWVQLSPGTMVGECAFNPHPLTLPVIDNWRVMHGRSAFSGSRRMCGAYVGADDWRSRRAALRNGKLDHWQVGW